MSATREFIPGWELVQILGEGTFAEVNLLRNPESGETCAVKEIDLNLHAAQISAIRKEVCLHKILNHENILKCFGSRIDANKQFIFLEYCAGGDLFDKIGKLGLKWKNAALFT